MKRITERLSSWPFFLGVFLLFELSLTCGCRDRESASVGVYGFGLAGCCYLLSSFNGLGSGQIVVVVHGL